MFRILAILLLTTSSAIAAPGAPTDCSGVTGSGSGPITFSHPPQQYVTVVNPNPSGNPKLAANTTGTAVIDGQGSFPMDSNGSFWTWSALGGYPPPSNIQIIGGSASTPYTCKFQ